VHRLDRDARGVVVLAHTREAAREFSQLLRDGRVYKRYRVRVRGDLGPRAGERGSIANRIRGREARSAYRVISYDPETDTSEATVEMTRGRFHQIRIHFAQAGYPLVGDRQHGPREERQGAVLALCAEEIRFESRLLGQTVRAVLE
jgi:tRNA pseudouridine32 synthase/23S rRNA pseudouridine746 synthase